MMYRGDLSCTVQRRKKPSTSGGRVCDTILIHACMLCNASRAEGLACSCWMTSSRAPAAQYNLSGPTSMRRAVLPTTPGVMVGSMAREVPRGMPASASSRATAAAS
eukprot:scaffold735_cov376-Prasinococcus_capsulatus_cf.AAC.17